MSSFSLRIRIQVPPSEQIGIERPEVVYKLKDGSPLKLVALDAQTIKEAEWLVLRSDGWESEEEANEVAENLMDALRVAVARFGMSANLGHRAPKSFVTRTALEEMSESSGRRTLNDIHGPIVFESEPNPMFVRVGTALGIRSIQRKRWDSAFQFTLESEHALTDPERVAFDLYDASFWVREIPDARFALQFAAVEALIEEQPRSDKAIELVDCFIATIEGSELHAEERDSLAGSLRWLRAKSIRSTGRDLVRSRLPSCEYGGRSAEELFLDCYDVRNRLIHGRIPLPSREEVGSHAAPLAMMVAHLLTGPTLELDV